MYRLAGICEKELFTSMYGWCSTVYRAGNGGQGLTALTTSFFKSYSFNLRRRVSALQIDEIVGLGSEDEKYTVGSDVQKAFAHIMCRIMHKMGHFDRYPVVLEYHRTNRITVDEAIDRMLSSRITFPSMGDMGGEWATCNEMIYFVNAFIENVMALEYLRNTFSERIKLAVKDLGFRIASGAPLTQAERSAYVVLSNVGTGSPGRSASARYTAEEDKSGGLAIAQIDDAHVEATFRELLSVVEPGPFLRFGRLTSNTSIHELFALFQPHVQTLTFSYVWTLPFGPFTRVAADSSETFNWDRDMQVSAYREDLMRVATFYGPSGEPRGSEATFSNAFETPAVIRSAAASPGAKALGALSSVDDKSYELEVRFDTPDLVMRLKNGFESKTNQTVYEWFSPVYNRVVSNIEPYQRSATDLLTDIALRTSAAGDNTMSPATLLTWDLIDPASWAQGTALRELIVENTSSGFDELVAFKETWNSKELVKRTVNTTPYYTRRGRILVRPPFYELVRATKRYFFEAEPEAETFIKQFLGLGREMSAINTDAVRVSHAAARWKRLFGTDAYNNLQLEALIKALTINQA